MNQELLGFTGICDGPCDFDSKKLSNFSQSVSNYSRGCSSFPKSGFMYALSNCQTFHISVTSAFIVKQPINNFLALPTVHPQKKKISWCVSSKPYNFCVITQGHGLKEQVKVNIDLTKLLIV